MNMSHLLNRTLSQSQQLCCLLSSCLALRCAGCYRSWCCRLKTNQGRTRLLGQDLMGQQEQLITNQYHSKPKMFLNLWARGLHPPNKHLDWLGCG